MTVRSWRSLAACGFAAGPHLLAADAASTAAWQRFRVQSAETINALSRLEWVTPVQSDDAVELSFAEFFGPIGDRGLE